MKYLPVLVIGIVFFGTFLAFAYDERIWLKDARINKRPVKLAFDSGSGFNVLFAQRLKRLGIKFNALATNSPSQGLFVGGDRINCTLNIGGWQDQTKFVPIDIPNTVDFDGVVGWWTFKKYIIEIDADNRRIAFWTKLPEKVINWDRFSVITTVITNVAGELEFEVPRTNHGYGVISIDTGSNFGMQLPRHEWIQWKKAHPHSPITLELIYSPEDGPGVLEEGWADQISIGSLTLTNVPVSEELPSSIIQKGDKDDGTLGLAALSHLNLIVDGNNSLIYLQPKSARPPAYYHNRLGAIFVPTTNHLNEAVAWVEPGSAAYEAGIRNNDFLLQIDGTPVISSHYFLFNYLFYKPAGTKLHLTLQRGEKVFKTTAILRQIIPPITNKDK